MVMCGNDMMYVAGSVHYYSIAAGVRVVSFRES